MIASEKYILIGFILIIIIVYLFRTISSQQQENMDNVKANYIYHFLKKRDTCTLDEISDLCKRILVKNYISIAYVLFFTLYNQNKDEALYNTIILKNFERALRYGGIEFMLWIDEKLDQHIYSHVYVDQTLDYWDQKEEPFPFKLKHEKDQIEYIKESFNNMYMQIT